MISYCFTASLSLRELLCFNVFNNVYGAYAFDSFAKAVTDLA